MDLVYNVPLFSASHTITEKPNPDDFQMHTHETCEFYYFISGKGVFHIEGTDYPLKPGDILLMDNTESHYIEIDPTNRYERFVVHFKKDFIKAIDPDGNLLKAFEDRTRGKNNLFQPQYFDTNLYHMLIDNIISAIPDNGIQITTNFYALLNEVMGAFSHNKNDNALNNDVIINKIIQYILDNLQNPITLNDICEEFFISKTHLCRMFKKSIGSTVWNYITVKRLIISKQMIEGGALPTDVYLKYGFSDYSAFYRAYKKQFGIPPSAQKNKLTK